MLTLHTIGKSSLYRACRRYPASRNASSKLSWASIDPEITSDKNPHAVHNLLNGHWTLPKKSISLPDPMNGQQFMTIPDTNKDETRGFIASLQSCSKSGLHNPYKNPQRYVMYGDVSAKAAQLMRDPEVEKFFVRLIQRVVPKSYAQARGEYNVCRIFMENFSGDQVRYLARSFSVPGDHLGQITSGWRWPYGPVSIISPFNFPLEIPLLQLMGALYMGNKVLFKPDSRVAAVMEQAIRMLHHCGMPTTDVDMINCDGPIMNELLMTAQPRMTQFTGSSRVAEMLAKDLNGRIKIEDAGFDWKVLGPDVSSDGMVDYVAWVSDQDAYAFGGQKCSAQSFLLAHENWVKAGFFNKIESLAKRRNLKDLTVTPVITQTNSKIRTHMEQVLTIPGAKVLFGGKELKAHSIPVCYGSWEPTAVFVPLSEIVRTQESFDLVTREVFGPFQIVTSFNDSTIDLVSQCLERLNHHLTAAIVSNDVQFQHKMIGSTINGTTYVGLRARTTGAPQNHWFGPAGDPRAAGIGTPEAIKMVWSCHRELIFDEGAIAKDWSTPAAT